MTFAYVFSSSGAAGGDLDKQLVRFMEQLRAQCGWGDAAVGVARNLFSNLLVKIAQSAKRWCKRYDRPEWDNLFKVR
jgi:hypothetical protein